MLPLLLLLRLRFAVSSSQRVWGGQYGGCKLTAYTHGTTARSSESARKASRSEPAASQPSPFGRKPFVGVETRTPHSSQKRVQVWECPLDMPAHASRHGTPSHFANVPKVCWSSELSVGPPENGPDPSKKKLHRFCSKPDKFELRCMRLQNVGRIILRIAFRTLS